MNPNARMLPPGGARVVLPAVSLALLLLSGGGHADSAPDPAWGDPIRPPVDPALEQRIDRILQRMPLDQKVGQIIQAEIQHVTPADVRRYGLGSVLNGGGSFPDLDRHATVAQWRALSRALHDAARQPMREGLEPIPLLWGTDAVHGHNNVYGATVFPHNIGLGATRDANLVRQIAAATARDVAATGIDWTFAPTLAVSRDPRWGRAYESFSSDPELVARLGAAVVLGLQGEPGQDWLGAGRVLATAKHFVGDGGTFNGVDQGDTRLEEAELAAIHGRPYRAALIAGVQTVMASFSSWNGRKMHGHRYLLTDVLKRHLGFDGFVIGDWNGHGQVPGCTVSDCLKALEAGVDMFMVPEDWLKFRNTLLAHAEAGRLPMARLDDAVRRILRVKLRAGLFDSPAKDRPAPVRIDSHAELARRAVRQSLVLLKNDGRVLPLDPRQRIAVVGDGADDIGMQSGGWTLDWQGVREANASFPNGQSIYAGLAEQIRAAGGQIHLGEDGLAEFEPQAIIAVIGELPYAEGQGDRETLEFQPGTRTALKLLDRMNTLDAPVITVFLSGRPMWVNPELNRSDAFVAAWLPGTRGGGIADVVLTDREGNVQYSPTGRLPFAWPAEPLPGPDGGFEPLFAIGYGLDYRAGDPLGTLPEAAMAAPTADAGSNADTMLFNTTAAAPWRLVLRSASSGTEQPVGGQIARTEGPEAVVVTPTDRDVQGDARRVQWTGASGDSLLLSRPTPIDWSGPAARGAALVFDLRAETPSPTAVRLGLECGPGCGADFGLAELAAPAATDKWLPIRLPLDCFARRGADLNSVSAVFVLSSPQPAQLSFANLRIAPGTAESASPSCPD